jgi:hypothetical protein
MGVVSLLCCDKAIWLGCEGFGTGGKYVWPYDGAKTGRGAAADSILVRDVVVESLNSSASGKVDEMASLPFCLS